MNLREKHNQRIIKSYVNDISGIKAVQTSCNNQWYIPAIEYWPEYTATKIKVKLFNCLFGVPIAPGPTSTAVSLSGRDVSESHATLLKARKPDLQVERSDVPVQTGFSGIVSSTELTAPESCKSMTYRITFDMLPLVKLAVMISVLFQHTLINQDLTLVTLNRYVWDDTIL